MANNDVTLEEQIVIQANEAIKALDSIKNSVKGLKGEVGNTGSTIKKGLAFGGLLVGGKRLLSFLKQANSDAMDLVETTNLFEVSMGKGVEGLNQYYEKAIKFQNQLSEALGTNINESMNFQALFNSMGTSMGLDRAVAYKISENFTKLGYDLASLYNTETDKAMQKLQSGLSGSSTRPLRAFGIDITQSTLSNTLAGLGLDKTIGQLNQAEKMVLRYITVLNQSSIAHGDFARTLESPANQLRIFQAQCLAFKQNIGSLWQGIYQRWMPYINGILMAINALIRAIGSIFGIKFGSSVQSIAKGLSKGAGGAGGIASGLKDAAGSAKDLKEELDLMPWDEIHNIELPKDTSSSGGGSSGGGGGGGGGGLEVDPALLNAMKEYDNMMDKVRNKATDIRDKIMEWLGFTKKINPFTNEISWEYTGMSKTARMILNALKAIVAVGITVKLIKFLGLLKTLIGVISGSVKPTTAFQVGLATIGSGFKSTISLSKDFVKSFANVYKATDGTKLHKFSTALKEVGKPMWDMIPAVVKIGVGLVGLAASAITVGKAMRDLTDGTIGATNAYVKLGAGLAGAAASGALIGSVFGPLGALIGAAAGAAIGLTAAFVGWRTEGEKIKDTAKQNAKAVDEYVESIKKERQAIIDNANSQMQYVNYAKKLAGELDGLVDAEGKVKAGMEDRVKFILNQLNEAMGTEYKLTNGQIEGYKEMAKSIQDVIEAKRGEIILQAYEEEYMNAIKRKAENVKIQNENQLKLNEALVRQAELKALINSLDERNPLDAVKIIAYGKELNNVNSGIDLYRQKLSDLTEQISLDNETIIDWENLKEATISGNAKKIGEAVDELAIKQKDAEESAAQSLSNSLQQRINDYNGYKEQREKLSDETYNYQAQKLDEEIDKLANTLATTQELINANNPEIVEAWRKVANYSEEMYDKYISLLPPETQEAIDNAIAEIDGKQPRAKKAGEDISKQTLGGAEAEINNPNSGVSWIGSRLIDGFVLALTGAGPLYMLYEAGKGIMNRLLQGAKEAANINSPSKETYKLGDFLVQGLVNGLVDNTSNAVTAMKRVMKDTLNEASKFADGVNVNPNEYSINANRFIDYGSISGSIASQVDISGGLSDKVYAAVVNGLQSSTVNVEIEAKTEEGVLLKKVQNQAKQYRTQTGKVPFPTM